MRIHRGIPAPLLLPIHSFALSKGLRVPTCGVEKIGVSCVVPWIPHTVAAATVVTRAFASSTDSNNSILTLYQYQICPFCNIAKTLLLYTKTPFQPIEVNPLTKAELKSALLPDKKYRKVPILTVSICNSSRGNKFEEEKGDDKSKDYVQQFNGSDAIVEYILSMPPITTIPSKRSVVIDARSPSALQWTDWGRKELAPLLYPNLCNTLANSYRAFGYVHHINTNHTTPFTLWQRYSIQLIGSIAMYLAASKIKRKRNITDERTALMDALKEMDRKLSHPEVPVGNIDLVSSKESDRKLVFLSGTVKPHLGDLTIYGVLRGLKGLAVMNTVHQAYPSIGEWYQRMEQMVETQMSHQRKT